MKKFFQQLQSNEAKREVLLRALKLVESVFPYVFPFPFAYFKSKSRNYLMASLICKIPSTKQCNHQFLQATCELIHPILKFEAIYH